MASPRAKRYSKQKGISVSAMVEAYLAAIAAPASAPSTDAPILRKVRGILKTADPEAYRRHLAAKYR